MNNTLTDDIIREIEAAAHAANYDKGFWFDPSDLIQHKNMLPEDAEFVAKVGPEEVLALIARVRELEAKQ